MFLFMAFGALFFCLKSDFFGSPTLEDLIARLSGFEVIKKNRRSKSTNSKAQIRKMSKQFQLTKGTSFACESMFFEFQRLTVAIKKWSCDCRVKVKSDKNEYLKPDKARKHWESCTVLRSFRRAGCLMISAFHLQKSIENRQQIWQQGNTGTNLRCPRSLGSATLQFLDLQFLVHLLHIR